VYLTEEEWEEPTLERLAQVIHAKCANPEKSMADWYRERSETRQGFRTMCVLLNVILGPIALLSMVLNSVGPWSKRIWTTLGLLLFLNAMLLFIYWKTTRRFRLPPSPTRSSSKT